MLQLFINYKVNTFVVFVPFIILTIFSTQSSSACTIFVLTNDHQVFFCNNEDWTNPATRIWFVQSSKGYFGCVYVGFNDGWARGGMNTKGLACDWVGGFSENWQSDASTCVRGNPTERILESCTTVDDVIAFFKNHKEPDFIRAKIFVSDKNGISAIIGVQNGKLYFEKSNRSQGFGYAFQTFSKCLSQNSDVTESNGASILQACLQDGKYATKYSNIYDLKSGDIYLYQFHQHLGSIRINLFFELEKGSHYFDMEKIHQQFSMPLMPLLMNMKRFVLDDFPPIYDTNPKITIHIRAIIEGAISGNMRPEDYRPELWSSIYPIQNDIQEDLKRYGSLQSITLVRSINSSSAEMQLYSYILDFENIRTLMQFELDDQNKVVAFKSEATERKPGAYLGE